AGATLQAEAARLEGHGVPAETAEWVASLPALYCTLDIIEVANQAQIAAEQVALVYFTLIDALELDWLAATIDRLGAGNHWQHRARSALLDNLYTQQRRLAAAVVAERGPEEHPQPWIDAWLAHNHAAVERLAAVLTDLKSAPRVDSSMLMVALGEVGAVG
ncbi:MAG TPA: NAD-glutamate dehydrogenase, partial [Plasticicumulans sp.]|nr:NAD-glutamate dehydrogenase [Plasticicumulans sp.]